MVMCHIISYMCYQWEAWSVWVCEYEWDELGDMYCIVCHSPNIYFNWFVIYILFSISLCLALIFLICLYNPLKFNRRIRAGTGWHDGLKVAHGTAPMNTIINHTHNTGERLIGLSWLIMGQGVSGTGGNGWWNGMQINRRGRCGLIKLTGFS